jgi:lipoprotein-releasing system permease protein
VKRLDWFVARRYLASRRKGRFLSLITLIAVGGVAVGVMALMIVIAVMTGLSRDLQAKILGSTPHIYVFQQSFGFRLGDWQNVLERVRKIPGVVAAEPFMLSNVLVTVQSTGGEYAQPGILYGIDPQSSPTPLTELERQIRAGEYRLGPTPSGLPGVLVGYRLADRLGLVDGDTLIAITSENIEVTTFGLNPRMLQYEVTGTFRTGMFEYDDKNLYAQLSAVQDLLGVPADTVSGLAVNVADAWHVEEVRARVSEALPYPFTIQDWTQINGSLFSALRLEKLAMAVILSLIILVAAFNIVSTLIMVVRDKTREIGILKSMGMTDELVLRIFVLQGLTIGVIGTLLGAVGGLVLIGIIDRYELIRLPGDVYFIEKLPLKLDLVDGALIVGLSLAIALLATIYPARQAAKLVPVDAIRYE